jgi:hypothetical protein
MDWKQRLEKYAARVLRLAELARQQHSLSGKYPRSAAYGQAVDCSPSEVPTFAKAFERIDAEQAQVAEYLSAEAEKILAALAELPATGWRDVLTFRYLAAMDWAQVAYESHCSRITAFRWRDAGISWLELTFPNW